MILFLKCDCIKHLKAREFGSPYVVLHNLFSSLRAKTAACQRNIIKFDLLLARSILHKEELLANTLDDLFSTQISAIP